MVNELIIIIRGDFWYFFISKIRSRGNLWRSELLKMCDGNVSRGWRFGFLRRAAGRNVKDLLKRIMLQPLQLCRGCRLRRLSIFNCDQLITYFITIMLSLSKLISCSDWQVWRVEKVSWTCKGKKGLYFTLKLLFHSLHNCTTTIFSPLSLTASFLPWISVYPPRKYINTPAFRHGRKTFWVFLIKCTFSLVSSNMNVISGQIWQTLKNPIFILQRWSETISYCKLPEDYTTIVLHNILSLELPPIQ